MKKNILAKAIVLTAMTLALTACSETSEILSVDEPSSVISVESEVPSLSVEVDVEDTTQEEVTQESTEVEESTEETPTVEESVDESTSTQGKITEESSTTEESLEEVQISSLPKEDNKNKSKDYEKYGTRKNGIIDFTDGTPYDIIYQAIMTEGKAKYWMDTFYITEYKGHDVIVSNVTHMDSSDDIASQTSWFMSVANGIEDTYFPYLIYDVNGDVVGAEDESGIVKSSKVKDGKTWYEVLIYQSCTTWIPEHNIKDSEVIYKKYVEDAAPSEYDETEAYLKSVEHVWNQEYVTVFYDYTYKDLNIFIDVFFSDKPGDVRYLDENEAYITEEDVTAEYAKQVYHDYIDKYGADFVYWTEEPVFNSKEYFSDYEHEWDTHGDPHAKCKTLEEHIAKCK